MSTFRTPALVVVCLAIIAGSSRPSDAAPITGTLDVTGINVSMNGADLAAPGTVIQADDMVATAAFGDLNGVPVLPSVTSFGPLVLDTTSLLSLLSSFSFSNATYGVFAASSASITTQEADRLELFFLGTFTPGPGLPGLDASPVRLDALVELLAGELGDILDVRLSLSPQVPAAPEPSTLALFAAGGLAIGGLALARRRRVARR